MKHIPPYRTILTEENCNLKLLVFKNKHLKSFFKLSSDAERTNLPTE